MKLVVMGVSGCGKSSVGKALAQKIGAKFIDGDDLHPESNKKKMSSGVPLDDADRWPWLQLVGETLEINQNIVIACSALKTIYREKILSYAPETRFIHLNGSKEMLLSRLKNRSDHFMPADLLESQLQTLEQLAPSEPGKSFEIGQPIGQVVNEISQWLEEKGNS
jgi:carbohydrate kinase (thermoresistant glucokinase family)